MGARLFLVGHERQVSLKQEEIGECNITWCCQCCCKYIYVLFMSYFCLVVGKRVVMVPCHFSSYNHSCIWPWQELKDKYLSFILLCSSIHFSLPGAHRAWCFLLQTWPSVLYLHEVSTCLSGFGVSPWFTAFSAALFVQLMFVDSLCSWIICGLCVFPCFSVWFVFVRVLTTRVRHAFWTEAQALGRAPPIW